MLAKKYKIENALNIANVAKGKKKKSKRTYKNNSV